MRIIKLLQEKVFTLSTKYCRPPKYKRGVLKARLRGKGEGYKRNPRRELKKKKRHISWGWGGG